ncbi:MAG TPA: hypothetical protein ENH82_04395 [bacterium]|nr:hypothetical protein [bacterium]
MAGKNIKLKGIIQGSSSVVATITSAKDGNIINVAFPVTTDPDFVVKTVYEAGGFKYSLKEMELRSEELKRTGGFGKFKVAGSVAQIGGDIEVDKRPNREVLKIVNLKYVVQDGSTGFE